MTTRYPSVTIVNESVVPEEINTLDEAVDAFNQGKDRESEAQFDQSDIAARTCIEKNRKAWGMEDRQILKHIGTQTDTSQTTMYARCLVGRVFPRQWREADENAWCKATRWSQFEVCARQWSKDDPGAAKAWLEYCVENDLSVRRLKAEIVAANGGPPSPTRPVYLLDAEMVTVTAITEKTLTVTFDQPLEQPLAVAAGARIVLTAVTESVLAPLPG